MSEVQIDSLRAADLARCAELELLLFRGDDPWSEAAFRAEVERGWFYVGAYGDSGLLGYAGLAITATPPRAEAEIHTIGVDPDFQRLGIGESLLKSLLQKADSFSATTFLEVRTDNASAIELYRKHGFDVVGLRRRYYQPSGADAYTMRRDAKTNDAMETKRSAR